MSFRKIRRKSKRFARGIFRSLRNFGKSRSNRDLDRAELLPHSVIRGRFELADNVINKTQLALQHFYNLGRHEGGHEGICFWAGTETEKLTKFDAVIVPQADHDPGRVFVSEEDFADAAREAQDLGLGILAQVHSHPSSSTFHSLGDDHLIIMPFENMLSVVAPHYGQYLSELSDMSVHQFQDGRWVYCKHDSVAKAFKANNSA